MNDAENQRDAPKWGHPCDCGLWHCTMEDKARADAEWAKLWHRLDAAIARAEQAEKRVRDAANLFGVVDGGQYWNDWLSRHERIEQAERERDTLRKAVADACDVAIWLSALLRNPDGASDPIAWKTWEEKMRPRLFAALAAVSQPQEGEA